jgi:hypothetical protein
MALVLSIGYLRILRIVSIGATRLPILTNTDRRLKAARRRHSAYCRSGIVLGNRDERGVVERPGRTPHPARDWMPPPDAERSAVRTNAAISVGRLPVQGDIHNSRVRRADAGRDNSGFSNWAGQRGRYRLGHADVQAAPLRLGLQLPQGPRPPHRLLGPHQVHPHRGPAGLVCFLRRPVAGVVSVLQQL